MKFRTLNERAKVIDDLIDSYRSSRHTAFVPLYDIKAIVLMIFPEAALESIGVHKLVFRLQYKHQDLALKIGRKDTVEQDHLTYKRFPPKLRHVYFARIFWHTRYCLLQEHGEEAEVSMRELNQLRRIGAEYGLLDINYDNIRNVNGHLKIIDANIAPIKFSSLWAIVDAIRLRLPEPIRRLFKRSRWLGHAKGR